jgi:hypothetical protein
MAKTKKTYIVAIDVKATYHVRVEAKSSEFAAAIAEGMQSTKIREEGKFIDVETEVIDVNEE